MFSRITNVLDEIVRLIRLAESQEQREWLARKAVELAQHERELVRDELGVDGEIGHSRNYKGE